MRYNEALRRARIAEQRGEIDGYRLASDREGYRAIYARTIDGDEVVFYDEREWY